jgi:putative transposase
MPGKAAKTIITERQQEILQSLAFARGSPQGLAHRAEIILLAFDGLKNEAIARKLQCERHGVGIWRRRWQKYFDQLAVIECVEKPTALRADFGDGVRTSRKVRPSDQSMDGPRTGR